MWVLGSMDKHSFNTWMSQFVTSSIQVKLKKVLKFGGGREFGNENMPVGCFWIISILLSIGYSSSRIRESSFQHISVLWRSELGNLVEISIKPVWNSPSAHFNVYISAPTEFNQFFSISHMCSSRLAICTYFLTAKRSISMMLMHIAIVCLY